MVPVNFTFVPSLNPGRVSTGDRTLSPNSKTASHPSHVPTNVCELFRHAIIKKKKNNFHLILSVVIV